MHVEPDAVAEASAAAWEYLVSWVPGGWTRREGGALAAVTGSRLSSFNGVWGVSRTPQVSAVADLLAEVASSGAKYCLQLRPGWTADIAEVAREMGLARAEGEPVMVLEDLARLDAVPVAEELTVRELAPPEITVHAEVAEAGFGTDRDAYLEVMTPDVVSRSGTRCYVGEVAGRAVTTAIGVTSGGCVAIFMVATKAEYRRRGYGAAITARAVRDGFGAGATWAWLSSSRAGFGVYSGLGFRVVEWWDFWEPTA